MTAPAISNADASSRNLSGKTRENRPTYGELKLANELRQAREEVRQLRAALKTAQSTIQDLAPLAGVPEVAEDPYTPPEKV